ncbi:MAG: deoxynucleoside kinase [Myxococcota bacterium]|nr:deoxynucleoside kinase [Myxococcota bacterium]MEC8381840.1 deoxynucleoside kinase [Myxococcota bacterium]
MTQLKGHDAMQELFIGIAGLIGAGKSTLATKLGEVTGLPVYYEPVQDNEYLADFYKDTAKYAFATQIYLLNRRFQQHQEIIWRGGGAVQDRTIYEDAIFAKSLVNLGLMDERDYRTYLDLFKHMSNFMCRPNIIIYLDIQPETSFERIQMRSRDVESGISLDYLQMLHHEYESFVEKIAKQIPVIRIPWEKFRDADEMAHVIKTEYLHSSFLREVAWDPIQGV